MKKKTALFLCKCGPNIAATLDLAALADWAEARGDLELVETHNLWCAPDGRAAFKAALEGKQIERVVMAACTPKMHEKTFQDLAEELGINRCHVQLANIREHCAWVTRDPGEALAKARSLINAAIARAWRAESLERRSMEDRTNLLVIGGGVAGIEAALCAARAGRRVTIVERQISLGGEVIRTEEVAPSMECSSCLLAPRLDQIREDPRIEVVTNAEVTEVVGFKGNFTATIKKRARLVEHSCIGCEACVEVCPAELPSPFHLGLGSWKAIHGLFPGGVPAAWVIEKDACLHFTEEGCEACVGQCPFGSINFAQADEELRREVGAVVLATGAAAADLSGFEELGHALPGVYSMPEFERVASNNGPHGGEIQLVDGRKPASVAVVHCAGSRREDGVRYCSGVCCVNALKVGQLLRAQLPKVQVTNFFGDLVLPGPAEQRFLEEAKDGGTRLVQCDISTVTVTAAGPRLRVSALGANPLEVEMVVLSGGLVPRADSAALAELLHLERTEDGFFKADHDLLHATGASLDGIFLAGSAAGPCTVATSVTRAQAAAGAALSLLIPGQRMELEMLTSVIDEELCAGCKLCLAVCPYRAIGHHVEPGVCRVNEALCRGCGTCTATCPSGASRAKHFTDEQLYAEIKGIVHE